MINDSGRLRGGGGRSTEDQTSNPGETRRAFHGLMHPVAEYIARQPSANLKRAAASRIATAVLATGDSLAEGHPNRWEVP